MKGIFLRREWVSLVCCFCIIGGCLVHTALGKETKALFPMMGVRVVLDAGHGGWDPGKTGTGGENEKILNLAVTEKLTEYLEQGGAEVILTRNADTALGGSKHADMAERQRIANETGADILVSIHQNAFPTTQIPAVIVECGFLSNAEEEKLLNDTAYQERLAWAVYCGILDYFEKISII